MKLDDEIIDKLKELLDNKGRKVSKQLKYYYRKKQIIF